VVTSVLVAVITSGTAMVVSLAGFALNLWHAGRTRRTQTLDLMARYRDPLLWAAFDLRSRLFNIVANGFLRREHKSGGHEWEYARNNTLFVIAEYLGWVEIVRRGIQFLDLGDDERNRRLVRLIHDITRTFARDKLDDAALRLYRGEQRAIGELMISTDRAQGGELDCMGYAAFCSRMESDEEFARWFTRLRETIEDLATREVARTDRLVALQNRLTDLIDFLDPEAVRFPSRRRDRLS
jgi:hypothetical protein